MRFFNIIYIAIAMMLVSSCYKDELVQDVVHNEDPDFDWGKSDSVPIVKQFYFKGKIDSLFYTFQDSIDGYYNLAWDSNYAPCDQSNYLHGQVTGFYNPGGKEILEIKLLGCISDTNSSNQKKNILYIGTYPYGSSSFLNPVPGVEVTWIDKKGRKWSSLPGSGQSVQNSFQILKIDSWSNPSEGEVIISGTMQMRLYYDNVSIPVEGGEFVLHYGIY